MTRRGMLDEPTLSRQWVARRLQRALTLDAAGSALRRGVARGGGADAAVVRGHARSAERRARRVSEAIREVGSEPYSSLRASRLASAGAGWVVGVLGAWAWRPALRRLAAHTLSEYDALAALADGAPGASADLAERLQALLPEIEAEVDELG